MGDTPGRMLELLSLLQARRSWTGTELAMRLEVTERTVRRDVDRLRELGYPVEAVPGRYGGYQLGRGGRLPPLLLGDDEAVAVALGLRAAVDGSVVGLEDASLTALAKLDQILPAPLAGRVRALHASTASILRGGESEQVDAAVLLALAQCCAAEERVRFDYTDRAGAASRRLVEPLRLVRAGMRWYLVARDVDRDGWRTFRLDRLAGPAPAGVRFRVVDPPDPVALVYAGITSGRGMFPFRARIRVPVPVDEAARLVPRTYAIFAAEGGETVIELGSASLERMVGYLAGLNPPCRVLDPPELRQALRDHARAVAGANEAAR